MKAEMKVKYLGLEKFRGRKDPDKVFVSAVFLQETETIKVFLKDGQEVAFDGIHQLDDISIEVDISIGVKTYVNLLSVMKLSLDKKDKVAS